MNMKTPGRKIYRTANGKAIDLDLLIQRNELTPAVGNARVNARGDELGAGGKIVRKREDVLKDYYNNTKGVINEPVSRPAAPEKAPVAEAPVAEAPVAENKVSRAQPKKVEPKNLPSAAEVAEWEEDDEGNFVKKGNK